MGAWGCEVLSNDYALDIIGFFVYSKDIESCIKHMFDNAHKYDKYELLLAVEIVDISLNGADKEILGGFYEYEDWFVKTIEQTPMEELRKEAIRILKLIQKTEEEDDNWIDEVKEDRKQLLKNIELRLNNKAKENL